MQSNNLIADFEEFNPAEDIMFSKPRVNKSGGKAVNILNSKSRTPLVITTPMMFTWGVSSMTDEKTGKVSWTMSLQFSSAEMRSETENLFLSKIQAMESHMKRMGVANSKLWLNKAVTKEQVDVLFHPMLYYPLNKETGEVDESRGPTFRIKLDMWDEKFTCEIYDTEERLLFPNSQQQQGPAELITKLSHVACILKCGGVWFANGKFGVTWRLVQAVVKPKSELRGRCFVKLSDDDKKKMNESSSSSDDAGVDEHGYPTASGSGSGSGSGSNVVSMQVMHDTDDEEEQEKPVTRVTQEEHDEDDEDDNEEHEEEAKPEPPPPPKQTTVVTKKKVVRKGK
jgi:hypothetical protein